MTASGGPVAGLAAVLLAHADVRHHHAAVHGLAHVVHCEKAHLHSRQRFHFHPGFAIGFHLSAAVEANASLVFSSPSCPRVGQKWARNLVAGVYLKVLCHANFLIVLYRRHSVRHTEKYLNC